MLLAKRGDTKGSWLSVPLNTHIWLGKITCTQQCCNALHSVACEQALHFKWWANAWVSSKAWSGGGKGELATITYKFSFLLHPDKAKYHWLKNNIPEVKVHWWQSWQTHHKFLLMLSEISWVDCSLSGKPEVFLGQWQGRRSPFPSMKNYCELCGGFFLKFHFGAPACSLHKPAIQKTNKGMQCRSYQENITQLCEFPHSESRINVLIFRSRHIHGWSVCSTKKKERNIWW